MSFVLLGSADCPSCECTFAGKWFDEFVTELSCPACGYWFSGSWRGFSFAPETERCP